MTLTSESKAVAFMSLETYEFLSVTPTAPVIILTSLSPINTAPSRGKGFY